MIKRRLLAFFLIPFILLLGCSGNSGPNVEQMKADLIGHELSGEGEGWKFAALSEFEYFDIRGEQVQGEVIEYDVSLRLVDLESNIHFLADILIVYKKVDGEWKLNSTVTKLFERL